MPNFKKLVTILGGLTVIFFISTYGWFVWEQSQPGEPLETTLADLNSSNQQEAVEKLKDMYGFDQPTHVRYMKWLKRKVTFSSL